MEKKAPLIPMLPIASATPKAPAGIYPQFRKLDQLKPALRHREAYMLMLYASEDGKVVETIWNARDGVTPFMVGSRDRKVNLQHVMWGKDVYAPFHVPNIGDRIFIDMDRVAGEAATRKEVDALWVIDPSLAAYWGDKESLVGQLMSEWNSKEPGIVIVDEATQLLFYQKCVEFEKELLAERQEHAKKAAQKEVARRMAKADITKHLRKGGRGKRH